MCAPRKFEHILPTLEPAANTGTSLDAPHIPSQGDLQQPMKGGEGGDTHKINVYQLNARALQAELRQVPDKGANWNTDGTS